MDGFPSTINQAKVTVPQCVLAKLRFYLPEHDTIIPFEGLTGGRVNESSSVSVLRVVKLKIAQAMRLLFARAFLCRIRLK